jgi:predicted RecB family nuclease
MTTITAHTLRNLLMCERRVWLDAHSDPAARDESAPETLRLYALGNQHEQRIHAATAGEIKPVDIASWEEGVEVTRNLMQQGVPGIIGACLEVRAPLDLTDTVYPIRGRVDQLLRVWHHGEYIYSPIEIKQRSQPEDGDWLQLDLYVWLLSLIQGTVPPAELWLSADALGYPRCRLVHEFDEERLMAAMSRVMSLLTTAPEPPVRIEPHCKLCHWYAACQGVAQREKHINLLYGVSRNTLANLEAAGILHLELVAALSPDELQQVKGIGPKTAPRIRANAQAWLENRPVWLAALPDKCRQPGWMFDLETLEIGGRTVPWCMGWCDGDGQTQIALVAPVQLPEALTLSDGQMVTLVPDSASAWEVFAEAVSGSDGPLFHWTGYDVGILRSSAPAAARARLEPRFHDLHATLKQVVSLPLKSTSIKPVSMYLGFEWPGYNDWFAAYLDYRHWLESGSLEALTRACMYQRADVQSMALVWRWLVVNNPDSKP